MLIQLDDAGLYEHHHVTATHAIRERDYDRTAALSAWVSRIEDLVLKEVGQFPEGYRGSYNKFTLTAEPYSVLDCEAVKALPEDQPPDNPNDPENLFYDISIYYDEFKPHSPNEDVRFTLVGYWTDGDVSGTFGYFPSEPDRIVVLFC